VKDDRVKAHDQVAVFFNGLVDHLLQGVQGDQDAAHGHAVLSDQEAHIVKILCRGQGGDFLQYLCNILYGHFIVVRPAKDKILYFRSMLRLFRYLAFPISLIYALVVHIRNLLYDWGLLASHSPDTPTICVGNLSVGGTGKTPMIEYLVRMLDDHRLALLSRGYKRKSKGFVLADARSSVWDLGDEPYQLHRKFPELAVAVDGDRRRGIRELQRLVSPELILLDDAFQHRRVRPALSILLTAYDKLYVDDRYLPTGSLRDAKGEASRADLILVTKCPGPLSKGQREPVVKKLAPKNGQKVLFAHLEYGDKILDGTGGSLELGELRGREVALVTGIASPGPLVEHLGSL